MALYQFNLCAIPYVVTLFVLLRTITTAIIRGITPYRRRTGLIVAGSSLAFVGYVGHVLADAPYRVTGKSWDDSTSLGWGIYAAYGALIALGVALLASTPIHPDPPPMADEPQAE